MAFVKGFENDVFINHTHRDNLSAAGLDEGWVSRLHADLRQRSTELLGQEADLWRDPKLRSMDAFDREIEAQVKASAILLVVVSPGYGNSECCTKERNAFLRQPHLSNRPTPANRKGRQDTVQP